MLTPTMLRNRSRHLDNSSNMEKGTDIHTKQAAAKGGLTVKRFHEHLLKTYG